MQRLGLFLAGAAIAVAAATTGAYASATDYVFEAVNSEIAASDDATVAVRLVHKQTGKPVTGAVITRTRLDMGPDGMADMATAIKAIPTSDPGAYAFKADLSMTGRWQLSLAAKVQGEPETLTGKITFTVK